MKVLASEGLSLTKLYLQVVVNLNQRICATLAKEDFVERTNSNAKRNCRAKCEEGDAHAKRALGAL